MANGYDYYEALDFAGTTASLSITKPGGRDSIPELEEVTQALNRGTSYVKKLNHKAS